MASETAVGLVTAENIELLRTVSIGIKGIISCYKANNLAYKAKIKDLEQRLEYEIARQRMMNICDLATIAFKHSFDLLQKINSINLNESERKYYIVMLEKQDERMNNIIDIYARRFS